MPGFWGNYILKGRKPVRLPESKLLEWAEWMNTHDRTVAKTRLGNLLVSTVFLGMDHNYSSKGPPVLFETMVFWYGEHHSKYPQDLYQQRFSTWSGSERHHKRLVSKLRKEIFEGEKVDTASSQREMAINHIN